MPTPETPAKIPAEVIDARRTQMRHFSTLMDSQFRIPGTNQRFGIDPVIGLIPGAGSAAGMLISAGIVVQAVRFGARGWTVMLMLFNVAIDAIFGVIPVIGSVFDVMFKANDRNVKLLDRHITDATLTKKQVRRSILWSIAVVIVFTAILLIGLTIATVWLFARLF